MPKTPKTTKVPAKRRIPTTDDLHLQSLLLLMDGNDREPEYFQQFIDAAHAILNQPSPFGQDRGTRSVHSYVVAHNLERWDLKDEEKHYRDLAVTVREIERRDDEPVKASSDNIAALFDLSINDAVYLGASLMFALLKGGVR